MYWCTSASATCTTSFATINTGNAQRVFVAKMICYEDNRGQAPYHYNRWFLINANHTIGYVNAESVRNQVSVRLCSNYRDIRATNWALDRVGQDIYHDGPNGLCLKFVYDAYWYTGTKLPGPTGPLVSAWQWYTAQDPARRHDGDLYPPRGALVFWQPDSWNPDGHVAISLGNGWTVSTMERSTTVVHLLNIAERNASGKPYGGYWR